MKDDLTLRRDGGSGPSGRLTIEEGDQNADAVMYWSGAWVLPTQQSEEYTRNEAVVHNQSVYVCRLAFQTSTAQEPGTGSDWELLGIQEAMQWKGEWSAGTYPKNSVVIRYGTVLIANKNTSQDAEQTSPDWDFVAFLINGAYLGGAPANFSPGSSYTAIQQWADSFSYGRFLDYQPPIASTGVITLPQTAEYKVNAQVIFQQGNTNKELACLLWIRSSVAGDFVLDSIQISDDKTDWRSVGGSFGWDGQKDETLQLGLSRVNQSMGTCQFQPCTFDVDMVVPADLSEIGSE